MHQYELLLLTVPEITEDEAKSLESQLDQLVTDAKGTTISFERWGKYKLAYPIKKNDYGVYFLMRFEIDQLNELLEKMHSLLKVKLANIVMRSMNTALSPKQSLAYQRPPSLEETPSRDVDSFLRENKMDDWFSSKKHQTNKTETHTVEVKKTVDSEKPETEKENN